MATLKKSAADRIRETIREIAGQGHGGFYAAPLIGAVEEATTTYPTMAVDGQKLLFNEEWIEGLPQKELEFILAHEAVHMLLGHPVLLNVLLARRPDREEEARIALELEANGMVIAAGIGRTPEDAYLPAYFRLPDDREARYYFEELCRRKDAEQAQQEVDDEQGASQDGSDEGQGNLPDDREIQDNDDSEPAPDGSEQPGDGSAVEEEGDAEGASDSAEDTGAAPAVGASAAGDADPGSGTGTGSDLANLPPLARDVIPVEAEPGQEGMAEIKPFIDAVAVASMAGDLPAWANVRVEALHRRSKNDVKAQLKRMFQRTKGGYTWARRNRKFANSKTPMPGRGTTANLKHIAIMEDVSGSTLPYRQMFFQYLLEVAREFPQVKLVHVPWDTQVYEAEIAEIRGSSPPRYHDTRHAGGTYVAPVFEWLKANRARYRFKGAVILTDGEFWDLPEERPHYPVLWCLAGTLQPKPAWGIVAELHNE